MSDGSRLLPTDLTGFTFNRLAGLNRPGGAGMGDESADWLVGWIEAHCDHGDSYDPQPYVQLARALEAGGAAAKAKAVRYARFEHKRHRDDEMDALDRAGLAIFRLFLGYGVHPFRLLYWFAGIVMLGWLFTALEQGFIGPGHCWPVVQPGERTAADRNKRAIQARRARLALARACIPRPEGPGVCSRRCPGRRTGLAWRLGIEANSVRPGLPAVFGREMPRSEAGATPALNAHDRVVPFTPRSMQIHGATNGGSGSEDDGRASPDARHASVAPSAASSARSRWTMPTEATARSLGPRADAGRPVVARTAATALRSFSVDSKVIRRAVLFVHLVRNLHGKPIVIRTSGVHPAQRVSVFPKNFSGL